ncbi:metallophosphoesterase [Thermodesulfobacteriota bacterium]
MKKSILCLMLLLLFICSGASADNHTADSEVKSNDGKTGIVYGEERGRVDISDGNVERREPGMGETESPSTTEEREWPCTPYFIILIFIILLLCGWIFFAQDGTRTRTRTKDEDEDDGDDGMGGEEDDGDDPRDTPPPTIYGEELDPDPVNAPPIYSLSDFHIGNGDKASNDMKKETLKKFKAWLEYVKSDVPPDADHYDVVMNGDLFDLWQAADTEGEPDGERFDKILKTNEQFFNDLADAFKSDGRMRFYYLIGNHDDGFTFDSSLKPKLIKTLREKSGVAPLPFSAQEAYSNTYFKLYAEHGHQHDSMNLKTGNDPSPGQEISEKFVNKMQEMVFKNWSDAPGDFRETVRPFENMELTPNKEMAKYFRCLKKRIRPTTPNEVKKKIEEFEDFVTKKAAADSISPTPPIIEWDDFKTLVDFIINGDQAILDKIDPKQINEDERNAALEKMDELNKAGGRDRVRIVLYGHTHIKDIHPKEGPVRRAYANTGTWLRDIKYKQDYFKGCTLTASPSDLPFVKVSAYIDSDGKRYAFMELKTFRDLGLFGSVLVELD